MPSSIEANTTVTVTAHIPPKTQRLRFVVRDMANGRMGTVDLNPAEAPMRHSSHSRRRLRCSHDNDKANHIGLALS